MDVKLPLYISVSGSDVIMHANITAQVGSTFVYTGASKDKGGCGCAIYDPKSNFKYGSLSIFLAKAEAISHYIKNSNINNACTANLIQKVYYRQL